MVIGCELFVGALKSSCIRGEVVSYQPLRRTSILGKAKRVTLLAPDPAEPPSIAAEEGAARLAWNGIAVNIRKFDSTNVEIGTAYLAQSKEICADLLIKGAYAHSRLRQMILGGRTRHILTNTEIPVFLFH